MAVKEIVVCDFCDAEIPKRARIIICELLIEQFRCDTWPTATPQKSVQIELCNPSCLANYLADQQRTFNLQVTVA